MPKQAEVLQYLELRSIDAAANVGERVPRSGNGFTFSSDAWGPNNIPRIRGVIDELVSGLSGGSEQLITNWPRKLNQWQLPIMGHIDLLPLSSRFRLMLGATIYVFDVDHQGGSFCVWPESHRSTWSYFSRPGEFGGRGELPVDELQDPNDPMEFVGKQGDALLWHGLLVHNVSMNALSTPRVAIFGRWGH